jgi:hypothetical protein
MRVSSLSLKGTVLGSDPAYGLSRSSCIVVVDEFWEGGRVTHYTLPTLLISLRTLMRTARSKYTESTDCLLGYDTVYSGGSIVTFRRNYYLHLQGRKVGKHISHSAY